MLETILFLSVEKLIKRVCILKQHCRAAAVTAIVAGCCRDALSYTVSEQLLLWAVIYFVCEFSEVYTICNV